MRTSKNVYRAGVIAAAVAVSAASLSACGSSSKPGSSAAAKDSNSTSFTYWSMWQQNEPQAQVIKKAAADFTASTGIKVNIQWQGRDVITKLTPTLRTGSSADLVDQSVNALGALVAKNETADLSSLYSTTIPGESQTVGQVIPDSYKPFLNDQNGKPFIAPYEVSSEGLWFDASKFPDLAANPPKTWADLLALFDKARGMGMTPLAVPGDDKYWVLLVLQRELGTDGLKKLASDKTGAAWDDPKVLKAAQLVQALRDKGDILKGYESSKSIDEEGDWAKGQAAFYLSGTWVPSEAAPNATAGFKFDSIQLPALDSGNTDTGINFFGFAVPKSAKHADAAEKFVAFFMKKEELSGISTQALNLTPRTDITPPAQLASMSKALTGTVYADQAHLSVDYADWTNKMLNPEMIRLITGQDDAAKFVSNGKQGTIDYWKSAS
ncbi:extracellular solute-binding protein [Catenulispora sp. NF23]|uniref:Extracellular solute-binding protein n=1 Tax=Catenulispora pinistramenti TaxID=2705254 RepID=A0ABS5L2Y8_9ACTN|nr:extracellular solute-binding protein [Catenulispora pinistramenti]MBS2536136.1 extracellular solute-binding protein [Catenulispora pinistramenti]MBS2552595.1 extracellular solute-binding protein [Catenulispora pinistramenti]